MSREEMQKRTEKEVRDCWGDAMRLLEKLDSKPNSTDVASVLLLPSQTQLAYGQQ